MFLEFNVELELLKQVFPSRLKTEICSIWWTHSLLEFFMLIKLQSGICTFFNISMKPAFSSIWFSCQNIPIFIQQHFHRILFPTKHTHRKNVSIIFKLHAKVVKTEKKLIIFYSHNKCYKLNLYDLINLKRVPLKCC